MEPQQVVVFCDWQNIYRRARGAYFKHEVDPVERGQVDPVDLGELLVKRGHRDGAPARGLSQVRIYRGMPRQERDERAYAAARSQHSHWSRNRKVELLTRPISYPDEWTPGRHDCDQPREKGVDVSLAVDLVTMASERRFDVGVVFSADNDLLPAVEYVARQHQRDNSAPQIEVAAWSGSLNSHRPSRLNPAGFNVWCHWLSQEDYWGVEDSNRYPLPAAPKGRPVPTPPRRF